MPNTNDQRLAGLRALCGYIQDSSFETVVISQDDATRTWRITVGGVKHYWGNSFEEALDIAIADIPCEDEGCPHYGTEHSHA